MTATAKTREAHTAPAAIPALRFGIAFPDLYERAGLVRVDKAFLDFLRACSTDLHDQLLSVRADPTAFPAKEQSALIVALAPYLEDFLGELFDIGPQLRALQARHAALAPLFAVKRKFVQKRTAAVNAEQAGAIDAVGVAAELETLMQTPLTEQAYAEHVARWMESEVTHAPQLKLAAAYAGWAVRTLVGQAKHRDGVLFKMPHKLDMSQLVPVVELTVNGASQFAFGPDRWRHREGFHLTDAGTDLSGALDQASYCIKCHHQGKDSCSHGLLEKTGVPKSSAFGIPLAGCPLEEKISEMHELKGQGNPIAALATVTIDNPMCAATGHRICNDCMKSCIYQKQEPVDIPQAETRTLKDVLELPWGFELYSLMTRWNPLNFDRPLPRPATGRKVLVVGLGPAGFTLAHHLMNDGHTVVAVDGLKIEPLPVDLAGIDARGTRHPFRAIRDITEVFERLDERVTAGFGGVAEYGITVRWNKNFLKVIRLLLERRNEFSMFGGVRFGGTMTVDSAFDMGFDHVALCMGAGRPTVIPMKNGLAGGVRQASDFLMALQLTGAAKSDSLANLQVRLPVVVIGGGLTAIDTATESLAYYPVQVEKFLTRYEALSKAYGQASVESNWRPDEAETAHEFIAHARAIRAERESAAKDGRPPRLLDLLNEWGGVTVAYRRRMIDAPSYTLNHEEIAKALEEGIRFAECLAPEEVEVDAAGAATALRLEKLRIDPTTAKLDKTGEHITLPARTILVAAGTQPNTVLAREDEHNVRLDGRFFQALDEAGNPVKPERISKPAKVHVLMSLRPDGRAVSFFGDLHPSFAGNVVKAMGGAKQGYPVVSRVLSRIVTTEDGADSLTTAAGGSPRADELRDSVRTGNDGGHARELPPAAITGEAGTAPVRAVALRPTAAQLVAKLNDELRATVHDVIRLTPNIVEVIVRAPMAARAFLPGQFYRLQNFEANAARVNCGAGFPACSEDVAMQAGKPAPQVATVMAMEGLALTGASVDQAKGLLSTIVLEMGGSSDLCALLKPGEPVVLMGPTGTPTETPAKETVLLAGGGLGNAVLFSIGQELRAAGSRVVYFAGYKKVIDRYKVEQIEAAADVVTWCCDEAPGFTPGRVQDRAFVGNIVDAMVAYAKGDLDEVPIRLNEVDRLIVIGSDGMMKGVQQARHTVLHPYLKEGHQAIGSINSPMQCMMKEICAQCLQLHRDPLTGKEDVVFSCANQDQPLDQVRFDSLRTRLSQNGAQEKLTKLWIDHCLRQLKHRPALAITREGLGQLQTIG